MVLLTGFRSYAKGRGMELGKVLRSKNRKKKLQEWIKRIGLDATQQLPNEWQRLPKNPRQEVRRFVIGKSRGKPVRRAKKSHDKAPPVKAASENHAATK